MTNKLLLLLLAGLLALAQVPARAQGLDPATALADSLADVAQLAREDTAIAVQRLFLAQRRTSRGQLLLSGVLAGSTSLSLALGRPETTYQAVSTGGLGLVAGYYTYQLGHHLALLRRFRARREQQVLENYENGQPLPPWVRKRLKAAYFSVRVTTY